MSDTVFSWATPVSGNWTTNGAWTQPGFPDGANDAAVIDAAGAYTVSLGGGDTLITVASLMVDDPNASLAINATGGTETVSGDVANQGQVDVDTDDVGPSGSTLVVDGTFNNLSGGALQIGNGGLGAPALVVLGALDSTGYVSVVGNYDASASQGATLDVGGVAGFGTAGVLTGSVFLDGDGAIVFAGNGAIGTIAAGAVLEMHSGGRLADASDTTTSSALAGLTENDGDLRVRFGDTLTVAGNLRNTGMINLEDADSADEHAVIDTVGGTLTNSGQVVIGGGGLDGPVMVMLGGLDNTGQFNVVGNYTSAGQGATADIAGVAGFGTAGVLTGSVFLDGYSAIVFAGNGAIGTIASGAVLELRSNGRLADASDTTTSSALDGLTENDGQLSLRYGAGLRIAGNLRNIGNINIADQTNNVNNTSSTTIAGTLTSSGQITIGGGGLDALATVSLGGLDNTGQLSVVGNSSTATQGATLDIAGVASFGTAGVLTGSVFLDGYGAIVFAGNGTIGTIASGAALELRSSGRLADASDTTTSSALDGLTENDGQLSLRYGAGLSIAGNLRNVGNINIADQTNNASNTSVTTIAGTLTSSGQINVGGGGLDAVAIVSLGGLDNTGGISVVGNYATASQGATVDVAGAAGFGTTGVLTGSVFLDGFGAIVFAGNGEIGTIASGAGLEVRAGGRLADASDTTTSSALTGLAENDGQLSLRYGAGLSIAGNLHNTGNINIADQTNNAGQTSLTTIAGTLDNSGNVAVGSFGLTANATLAVGALTNTGYLQLEGNNNGATLGSVALLSVGGAAGFGTVGVLTGNVYLDGHSTIDFAGGGEITTIATGAILDLRDLSAIADGTDATSTALTGLAENDGQLDLGYETLAVAGNLDNAGQINVDNLYGNGGGSLLRVAGTLVNKNQVELGEFSLASNASLSAAAIVNTGYLQLEGNNNGATLGNVALLSVGGAAGFGTVGVLTGNVYLDGHSTIDFAGGGEITTIATGAILDLRDLSAIADGTDATNTALSGLAENDGQLDLGFETLAVAGNLDNTNQINVDNLYGNGGGSLLRIAGTLVNTSQVELGEFSLASNASLAAAAIVNTGYLQLEGNNNGATLGNVALLSVGGAAGFGTVGVLTGNVYLDGHSTIDFAGGGEITTIATGAILDLRDLSAIADGTDATNTALTGLAENDGQLDLGYETLAAAGNLDNAGQINVDNLYGNGGGSLLRVAGTLVNTNQVELGESTLTLAGTIAAGVLLNQGLLQATGAAANAAVISIGGGTNSATAILEGGATLSASGTFTQAAGAAQVLGALDAGTVSVTGGILEGTGTLTAALVASGGTVLAGADGNTPGTLTVAGSYTQDAGATLRLDVSGAAAGQQALLDVSGPVTLNGTLDLELLHGATLAAGQAIVVATATPGGLAGTFAAISEGGHSGNGTASLAIGNGLYLNPVYDTAAGQMRLVVSTVGVTPPAITAPGTILLNAGTAGTSLGISVATQAAGTISVQLADNSGVLGATAAPGATVGGVGSTVLTLAGSVAAVDQELATLTDTPSGAATSDQLTITATDSALQVSSDAVDVSINQPPTIVVPAQLLEPSDQPGALRGLSLGDPDAIAAGETLTVTLSDTAGLLSATAAGGGSVTGSGSTLLVLTGGLTDVDAELAATSFTGTADDSLRITASDGRGGTAAASVPIRIAPGPVSATVTPTAIAFGNVHAGATAQQGVTIDDTGSLAIGVGIASTGGAVTAAGTIAQLGAGVTDTSAISVGLSTNADGPRSGSATLLISHPGSAQAADLLLQPQGVSGSGSYSHAATLLTDGAVPPDGTPDASADAVSWTDPATSFLVNLGSVVPVAGLLATVDALGTYVVSASTDDTSFAPLVTITPDGTAAGLVTVSTLIDSAFDDPALSFPATQAQYLRLQAMGGDGTYAAAELDAFAAAPTVQASGTVFNLATADVILPPSVIVHVHDTGTIDLSIANTAPADGYSEGLIAGIAGVSGGITIATGGQVSLAPGATATDAFTADFPTDQVGAINAAVTLAAVSDGGTGAGSLDRLGQTTLAAEIVPITIAVDAYANPVLAVLPGSDSLGTIGGSGAAQTLDIGAFEQNTGSLAIGIGVLNQIAAPADALSGSIAASGQFNAAGFGTIGTIAAGGIDAAPGLSIGTGTNGTFTETVTLAPVGSNASGYSAALPGQTLTVTGTVADLPSPVIDVASAVTATAGTPMQIGPITISDPNTVTQNLTVTLTDAAGLLNAVSAGDVTVSGQGTGTLTLVGSLADLNTTLASATYDGSVAGSDTINLVVTDEHRARGAGAIAVTTDPMPQTAPVLNAPGLAIVVPGQTSGLGAVSISDPTAQALGQMVTLTVSSAGLAATEFSASGGPGGTVTGQGTGTLTIVGSVSEVNSYLSDGVTENILQDAYMKAQADAEKAGEEAENFADIFNLSFAVASEGLGAITSFIVDKAKDDAAEQLGIPSLPSGQDFAKALIQLDVGFYSFAANVLNDVAAIAGGATSFPPPAGGGGGAGAHLITFSGQAIPLDVAGEYLLSGSSDPNDSFSVGVRLQPLAGNASASAITQVAAALGTDRVTFGTGRDAVAYVNGVATTLAGGKPLSLSGGQVSLVSPNTYQVNWNTGEQLTVTDEGSYLNANVGLGANNTPGSVVGLMGPAQGVADDFTLPDGTVIPQPLSQAELNQYAQQWLVPVAANLFDYAPGQSAATFDNPAFPTAPITLADLPAAVVAAAGSAVAAAGITDPGAAAAAEFDYIVSGGDPNAIAADQALFRGLSTTLPTIVPSGTAAAVLGVLAAASEVAEATGTATPVVFQVYLTAPEAADTVVDYTAVAPNAADLGAAAYGGTLPAGQITIAAGQTIGSFTIDVPVGALGSLPDADVAVQITSPGTTGVFAANAAATVATPQPGPPPVPELVYLGKYGTFVGSGDEYTLDLGAVQYGQALPTLQFGIENAATAAGADQLGGTVTADTVEGFTVQGADLPAPLNAGQSYTGMAATINTIKFGDNTETITYTPTDTNASGFSQTLAPVTLTIADTLELPGLTYSQAWGDVHIITYNGLEYDFQAVGEFWLAQSKNPLDSFGIQLRLQPYNSTASVTVITEVAASVGAQRVTFDIHRAATVWVDGNPSTLSAADPTLVLAGGTITEVSPSLFRVNWNTGEMMTVTDAGSYFNVVDGIPPGDVAGGVAGLQGEAEGQQNDFQLPDGTVLPQPLSSNTLYNVYGNAWRVSQTTSLFDYDPGQTTATFTDTSFPADVVRLSDLPQDVVAQAASVVAAAGINDPQIAQAAELDYLASGDMSFVNAAANAQAAQTVPLAAPTITESAPVPALLVEAAPPSVVEAASGMTPVVFDVMLTGTLGGATPVDYSVVDGGAGFLGSTVFSGSLPSGSVTIAAGATIADFTIDVPDDALGSAPNAALEVQITAPGGNPIFAPTATATVVNNIAEAGGPAVPSISDLTAYGSFFEQGGTYVLDLGTLTQGAAVPAITLAISNSATAPADDLTGHFAAPVGNGFTVTGASLPAALLPGEQYGGIHLTTDTAQIGAQSETLVFSPLDVNDSGYMGTLSPVTLILEDTIGGAAAAALNTPSQIVFPNVRVGTPESHLISVSNTAVAPAAALDVNASATGAATVGGAISGLAAGATDAQDLTVGLNTGTAGILSGMVQLAPVSDAGGSTLPLNAIGIDVFGDVFRTADPQVSPVQVYARVNDPGSTALTITNADPADGASENLIAALTGTSAGIGIGSAGPTGTIVAGGTDHSLTLTYATQQVGTITGTATLAAISDGGIGTNSIDGLGRLDLAPVVVPVQIDIDNPAAPVFEEVAGPGSISAGATLDLGTIVNTSAPIVVSLAVLNAAAAPADALGGSFAVGGSAAFSFNGIGTFDGIAADGINGAPTVTLDASQAGSYLATLTLSPLSEAPNGDEAPLDLADQTLTILADVVPCFLAGTRIRTPGGEVAVERLRVGDRVCTADGGTRPIVWIGERHVDCAAHPDPAQVLPVRIRRGAFGRNLPARDLLLSPDHALHSEGVLIPARYLIDGRRVVQRPARRAHYLHIELDRHDIVLAEGLPVESYLETGRRAEYATIGAPPRPPAQAALTWDSDGCAPLCVTGPALERARARLRRGRPAAASGAPTGAASGSRGAGHPAHAGTSW